MQNIRLLLVIVAKKTATEIVHVCEICVKMLVFGTLEVDEQGT